MGCTLSYDYMALTTKSSVSSVLLYNSHIELESEVKDFIQALFSQLYIIQNFWESARGWI